jgi:hypothetical protein
MTYFAMLFSAGIGVGLFFYGVSEPLWHQSSHWFANSGYRSQDEIDMFALNLTVFHWGITGWSQYLVVAICCGLASYRFNLPMTLRSCFYPMLGEYTWGWIGDVIDGFTIVTTVAGVCTSLGLGAFQIAAGLKRVGAIDDDLSEDKMRNVHVISIWVITLIATCSVVSGLNVGIKYLSQLGFGLGMLLLFLVLVMEKTNYILNLIVQVRKDNVCVAFCQMLFAHHLADLVVYTRKLDTTFNGPFSCSISIRTPLDNSKKEKDVPRMAIPPKSGGWTAGPFSTLDGGSPGPPLSVSLLLASPKAELLRVSSCLALSVLSRIRFCGLESLGESVSVKRAKPRN